MIDLVAGSDFRRPEYRREVFHRIYSHALRYRSHPGGVYYALPAMAAAAGWDTEQRLWAAAIQGNTQHPPTTWLLMQAGDHPGALERVIQFWRRNYGSLGWDTDRRHHKSAFDRSLRSYVELTAGGQERYWRAAAQDGWPGCWRAATAIHTFGRLSAWSYLEYVRILTGLVPDADTLMLEDFSGSRSHRNGLFMVLGQEELIDDVALNPTGPAVAPRETLSWLTDEAERLLAEAIARNPDQPDVGRLTFESICCTTKSMYKARRRYPGVYNDLLYDRIRAAEHAFGLRFDVLWQARHDALPAHLRLEDTPGDPGCVPVKQDWFRETGQVINMTPEYPCFASEWDTAVAAGTYADQRRWP